MRLANLIGGELVTPQTGAYLDCLEPATGSVYAETPDSGQADVEAAVRAASSAFAGWSRTPADQRSNILVRIADLIDAHSRDLSRAESKDTGKPVTLASTIDIPGAARNFRFFATSVLQFSSESYDHDGHSINYTLRQPLGVVGCISPWNLPLYLFAWKIAPALATGNTVVAKPSEITPMTASMLSDICLEAGLPNGVLNIVHGAGPTTGQAIVAHPEVRAVSFTGGTATGATIARIAGPMFKKISLELGGKNPNIVFADCDYDRMLAATLRSSFANQGQICLCGSRILIERPLYERFRHDFIALTETLRIGDPADEQTDHGAVVSGAHCEKILSYIDLAKEDGGTILTGGHRVEVPGRCAAGWFVAPTIIEGLDLYCRTNQEEIFGPVVTISPFDTEDEALSLANGTPYGLATMLWTNHLRRAHRMAAALQSGIVWVNCWMVRDLRTPFGGMKSSGVGREGGDASLRFFTEPKNVCISIR